MIVGRGFDALISLSVIGTNIAVAVYQEVRAKRTLDKIALLARPDALVRRDGEEHRVPAEDLVIGDLVGVVPGDQIVLDGQLVQGAIEADESLLTGESDLIHHEARRRRVLGQLLHVRHGLVRRPGGGRGEPREPDRRRGRGFRRVLTPVQREINLVIRIVLAIVVYLQVLLIFQAIVAPGRRADRRGPGDASSPASSPTACSCRSRLPTPSPPCASRGWARSSSSPTRSNR